MTRLGSLVKINPESVSADFPYAQIEYVDIAGVGPGVLDRTRHLPLAEAPSRARRVVRKGDTLLATVRPNLRSFWFARAPAANMVASTGFAVLRANDGLDERFLYYLVSDQAFTDYLTANVKGAAYPAVDARTIARAKVHVPPLPIQRKIAAILSAYDDLIENSLRRIEILEEMARNLYREWFVDFRFPGHESARFVDSPLGRIPEGWRVERLGDVATIRTGRSNRQDAVSDGAFPFFDRSSETKRSNRFLFDCEAVIVPGEGRRFRPRYWRDGPFDLHQRVYGLMDFEGVHGVFVYFALLERHEYFARVATGATVKSLRKGMFERFEFLAPSEDLMERFREQAGQTLRLVGLLAERNEALREARDLLLPKLISGDLDVSDLAVRSRPLYAGDPRRLTEYRFFREIAALPFVEKIALFGSRARGDHEERSDIDLCVFCGDAGEDEWLEVLACLERDRVDTLLKVDCTRFEASNAALRENVLTEGIVLFERKEGP